MVLALFKSFRPHQWVKNTFVAAPLVFARRIDDPTAVGRAAIAVLCFCLLSSAVYLINDVIDVDKDRAHPMKRFRPIASGVLPVRLAKIVAAVMAAGVLAGGFFLDPLFALVCALYLALNAAYSFRLKHVPFVDVGCIALGFVLRVFGGASAVPVDPSGWLLVCTVLLASLLGFGKRAHELRVGGEKKATQRIVLDRYPPGVLSALLTGLAIATTGTYAAYTQSQHAQVFFGTRHLAFTIPLVAFGIFRFLWITRKKLDAESPTDSMLRDIPFLVNLVLYAGAIVAIIYFGA